MTDAAPEIGNGAEVPTGPAIRVLTQFIRDLSFENPRAPDSLSASNPGQPQIDLGVELSARGRIDGLFEVDIKVNAAAVRDNSPVFQLELVYGGLFQIQGVPEADLEPVLLIECPRFVFPFARRLIADVSSDGGFPPLFLEPFDFAALYAQRKASDVGPAIGNA
jgi:preprotein translocase subunit SecB